MKFGCRDGKNSNESSAQERTSDESSTKRCHLRNHAVRLVPRIVELEQDHLRGNYYVNNKVIS